MTVAWISLESPVGPLVLEASEGTIRRLEFACGRTKESLAGFGSQAAPADAAALDRAAAELDLYFKGQLVGFTVPVAAEGPPFHVKVWDALRSIPAGEASTYSEIARRIGSPGAARAVGNACARNPVAIIIPCHRALARHGLGGFGGGLEAKRWLLRHENYPLPEGY